MKGKMKNFDKKWVPDILSEGCLEKSFPGTTVSPEKPHDRVYKHQTFASARRFAGFRPYSWLIPKDNLDFILASSYNHEKEIFPDRVDVLLQAETRGIKTWRNLGNFGKFDGKSDKEKKFLSPVIETVKKNSKEEAERYNNYHPLVLGGITYEEHPSHVKLMNSSHHSPQTIRGYTRQDRDGSYFFY